MSQSAIIQALSGDKALLSRGTAWLSENGYVVTAAHVVTDDADHWLCDSGYSEVQYAIVWGENNSATLKPVCLDIESDIALLQLAEGEPNPLEPIAYHLHANAVQEKEWRCPAFPIIHTDQNALELTGTLTKQHKELSRKALQLQVIQGTNVSWEGASGSPILIDGQLVGVITLEMNQTGIAWAAPARAVQLLERFARAVEQCDTLIDLIKSLYPKAEQLESLAGDLHQLSALAIAAESSAGTLAKAAWRYGITGLRSLLATMRSAHPNAPEIVAFEESLYATIQYYSKSWNSKARLEIAQEAVAKQLKVSRKATEAWNELLFNQGYVKALSFSVEEFSEKLLGLSLECLLGSALEVQRSLESDTVATTTICDVINIILPALLNEDQRAELDYILGTQDDTLQLALIQLPTGLETVAEIIMAAADGRPAAFQKLDDNDRYARGRNAIAMPPELGMKEDSQAFDKAFDDDVINEVLKGEELESYDRSTQIEFAADELEFLAKTNRQTRYALLVHCNNNLEYRQLQAHFTRIKQRYPALVCLYLCREPQRTRSDRKKYRAVAEIMKAGETGSTP